MNEKEKAVSGLVKSCWKSAASIGIGFIFDDIAQTFAPPKAKPLGRFVRAIGAFTIGDAVCDRLTDPYIDKRFEEMEAKLAKKEEETEEATQEEQ